MNPDLFAALARNLKRLQECVILFAVRVDHIVGLHIGLACIHRVNLHLTEGDLGPSYAFTLKIRANLDTLVPEKPQVCTI
jgi:hypothetical protein